MSDEQQATIIEQLDEIISQDSQIIENQQNYNYAYESYNITLSSRIDDLNSKVSSLNSYQEVLSSQLEVINNAQGGYLKEEVLTNNELFYKDVATIKELFMFNFVFIGVLIAFIVIWIFARGFIKHVSS